MLELLEDFVDFMNAGPGIFMLLFLGAVTAPAIALLHECGHSLATKLLVGDASIHVNLLPDPRRPSGFCTYDASRATRLDTIIIALAGPAVSALGAFVAWPLYSQAASSGLWHDVCWMLLASNAGGAALNLMPLRLREGRNEGAAVFWLDGRVA